MSDANENDATKLACEKCDRLFSHKNPHIARANLARHVSAAHNDGATPPAKRRRHLTKTEVTRHRASSEALELITRGATFDQLAAEVARCLEAMRILHRDVAVENGVLKRDLAEYAKQAKLTAGLLDSLKKYAR